MAKKRGKAKQKSSKRIAKQSHSKAGSTKRKPKKRVLHFIPRPKKLEEHLRKAPHELEEEFFIPSPIHKGKYRIPMGIRFLIGYLIFLSALYLVSFIYGITFPTTILFGKMMTGARALIINAVLLAIILFMVYGFWRRKAYTFDLSIGFFSFSALNAMISLILFESAEHPAFKKLLLLSFISLIVMNFVIIWYILHERKYFYAEKFKDRPFHHRDKFFLYTIITFWVIAILIGVTFGVQFYQDTTRMIDESLMEMQGDYYRGQLICEQKSGTERDVCTLVIATALSSQQRPESEMLRMCDSIESDFYRFTCMRSIAG